MFTTPRYGKNPARAARQYVAVAITALLFLQSFAFTLQLAQAAPLPTPLLVVSNGIVISQVYGGGGNTGATYKNDFIELFNRGTTGVSLNGLSLQYASANGTGNFGSGSTQLTELPDITLAPGQYYLVQEAGGAVGAALPTADHIDPTPINLSGTAGKVALVTGTTTLGCNGGASSSNPCSADALARIIDLVGYGNANFFEGAGPAPTLSNTTAAFRAANGCTDTDNNSADFTAAAPTPRNSSSPTNVCGGNATPTPTPTATPTPTPTATPTPTPTPSATAIHDVQGSGSRSPLVNQTVTVSGIVTGLKSGSSGGFFIQEPDANVDGNPTTSEGIFVFTGSALPANAVIGNYVNVTGTVVEFVVSTDPNSPPLTEISNATVSLISTGNALPAPITLTAADTNPSGSIEQLEKYEGMRVRADSLTAIAPTQGNVSEPNATATSNGVFYAVLTGVARPFREPGIEVPDPVPSPAPCCVPRFDANPERLRVDSDAQPGAPRLDVTTGAIITNVTGPLDYAFRTYTILPDAATPPVVSNLASARPVPEPTSDELTIAAFNMQRFFDTTNDPGTSDPVLTTTAFNNRLNKASLAIRNVMRSPDIIGVQEVENLTTLQAVADKLNSDTVAGGGANPNYTAYLVEGNDVGGIDVGFLVKASRVNVISVTQEGKDTTYTAPDNTPDILNDRPPLILRATAARTGSATPLAFTVIVNHLRSFSGIDDPVDGPRVRAKRRAQAEFLANLIQSIQTSNPTENIVSVGDYNSFQFNDGYVDVIGTIKGTPTPPDQVLLASSDLVNPDLIDLVDTLPAEERYSYSFDGNAQVLDHILVNQNANALLTRFAYARNDADFPEIYRNDPNRPERISDHDMPVAYFNLAVAEACASDSSAQVKITPGGFRRNRATGRYVQIVTLQNTGSSSISAPVSLVLRNLSSNATLFNKDGDTSCLAPAGAPFKVLNVGADNVFSPGETVTVELQFTNPTNQAISYTTQVVAGSNR